MCADVRPNSQFLDSFEAGCLLYKLPLMQPGNEPEDAGESTMLSEDGFKETFRLYWTHIFKAVQVYAVKADSFKVVQEWAREAVESLKAIVSCPGLLEAVSRSMNKLASYYCIGVHLAGFEAVQPAGFEAARPLSSTAVVNRVGWLRNRLGCEWECNGVYVLFDWKSLFMECKSWVLSSLVHVG